MKVVLLGAVSTMGFGGIAREGMALGARGGPLEKHDGNGGLQGGGRQEERWDGGGFERGGTGDGRVIGTEGGAVRY